MKYLVVLPFEVFTPAAIAAGIEVWTWVISEKPEYEIGVMMEINSAWLATVRFERGMFSTSQKYSFSFLSSSCPRGADKIAFFDSYDDPFFHSVQYSPTDKEEINRGMVNAKRLLAPHVLILQMLISRLQAARYRRPGLMLLIQRLVLISARAHRYMRFVSFYFLSCPCVYLLFGGSTHPLAREARFSFLLFGFETLRCSNLDADCENALRDPLYSTAFAWFSVRPLWVPQDPVPGSIN
jgi:phosphatidylinositol 4-kinase